MPGKDEEFATWQQHLSGTIETFPGFLDHTLMPPAPPSQVDWVIVQRFRSMDDAQRWMRSSEREALLKEIAPILVGTDDIHFFTGQQPGPPAGSVSAVISTRVAPGHEQEYRAWQRRIAAAEAAFPGFQGTRVEPPVPGVQEDWAAVVRFDTDEHLQAWLDSEQRRRLLDEAMAYGAESHVRKVQGGFDNWFTYGKPPGTPPPPVWKQNMVVLLVLYPVVFLFGAWFSTPYLVHRGMPLWLALFLGNVFSVFLTGYLLIPWGSRALTWWLSPRKDAPAWTNAAGTALVIALYCLAMAIFSRFP
jgi:antibiotic biosynthesis monooxygenase (ABM) superfamily enzyme